MRRKTNPMGWLLSATLMAYVMSAITVWLFRRCIPQQVWNRRGR